MGATANTGTVAGVLPEAEYKSRLEELVAKEDYAGAVALQRQKQLGLSAEEKAEVDEVSGDEEDERRVEESQDSTDAESDGRPDNTRILRMLYQGNVAEATRQNEVARKSKVFNGKHGFYKKTWVTSLAQETASVHPRAGAVNVYDDSSDEEAYTGEQKEIAREVDELRVARH